MKVTYVICDRCADRQEEEHNDASIVDIEGIKYDLCDRCTAALQIFLKDRKPVELEPRIDFDTKNRLRKLERNLENIREAANTSIDNYNRGLTNPDHLLQALRDVSSGALRG